MTTTIPMLPGQAAAPEGPCDLTGMYVIHHGFRRDLDRFAAAARLTPQTDTATWAALLERWDRFAHLLHDHHTKEDELLWPLLDERVDAAGDTWARAVLDAMAAEHDRIDPLLAQVRGLVERADGGRLADVLAETSEVLDAHLAHEERDAVAVVQRYVTGPEWQAFENGPLRGKPSLGEVLYFLPWLAEGLAPDVLATLLAQAGLAFRLFHRLGRGRFARLEHRAFGRVL